MRQASTLTSLTTGDSVGKIYIQSLNTVNCQCIYFLALKEFHMLEKYFGSLKVEIIMRKYS